MLSGGVIETTCDSILYQDACKSIPYNRTKNGTGFESHTTYRLLARSDPRNLLLMPEVIEPWCQSFADLLPGFQLAPLGKTCRGYGYMFA